MFKTEDSNGNIIYHYRPLSEYGGSINFNGHKNSSIFLAPNARLEEGAISVCGDNATVFIGNGRLGRAIVSIYHDCTFYLGSNGYINGFGDKQRIQIAEKTAVIIGDRCWFSYPLEISTSDVHLIFDIKTKRRMNQSQSIYIGDHVWLGRDVRIYKGARISSGSIVATKAFLSSKLYPSHSVIAGVPGKPRRCGEVFWEGHSSLIFTDADTERYAQLEEDDPFVKQFIYHKDKSQIITPQDIEANLNATNHSTERIAFLYEILHNSNWHNRFVWDDEEKKEPQLIPLNGLFQKEIMNAQPYVKEPTTSPSPIATPTTNQKDNRLWSRFISILKKH